MMTVLLALFAIAAMVWGLVAARKLNVPFNCLLVVLCGAVIGHAFFNRNIGPVPVTIDRVLWGCLIVQFVVLLNLGLTQPKSINRTDLIVLALGALLTLSTFLSDWQYKENLPLSRLLFFNWMPIGIYFVAKHCSLQPKQLGQLYLLLALFGIYLSVTAIAEQRGWHWAVFPKFIVDPQHVEFLGRARGPFLNPVSCGVYLIVCGAAGWLLWPTLNRWGRACIVGFSGLIFCATFLTFTRSVWVSAAVALFIVVWTPAKPAVRGGLVIAGTICLVISVALFADRFNSFKRDKHVTAEEMAQSASLRPMLAFVALKMFRDRPIFGCGFGQYTKYKKPYHYQETADMPLRKVLPYMQHNVFLSYLTESGLAGLSLLVAFLTAIGVRAWSLWRSHGLPLPERQLGLLALVILACYIINGMFHDVSIIPHIGALLFLIAGFVENVASRQAQHAALDAEFFEAGDPQLHQAA